jgi:hypothetical protein
VRVALDAIGAAKMLTDSGCSVENESPYQNQN